MKYKIKEGTKKDSVVFFTKNRITIELDKATQKELKILFDMKHPFVEVVK